MMKEQLKLKAGVGKVDISPKQGLELAGYPHCPRYNTGVHDPLYAACIYLDDGNTKIAIVTMDLLFYSKKYVKELRAKVEAALGISGKNIMLCCSHTHSAPWAAGRLDLESLEKGMSSDPEYVADLQNKLFDLIADASRNTFDAKVGVGTGYCGREQGVGGNRREPSGLADPSVCVIGVQNDKGEWKGCLVEYALHPTFIHAESTVVTADYPGYIKKYLSWTRPGIVTLFAQGTSGNQSSRYFRDGQNYEEACRVGTTIGVEVNHVLNKMNLQSDLKLMVQSLETDLELKIYPPKAIAEANVKRTTDRFHELQNANASYIDVRNAELKVFGAEDILGYIILKEKGITPELLSDEVPMEIQVIGIGDYRILGLQGEVFVEFGLQIKKDSPYKNTFVFELANGAAPGYIYTKESLAEGGYETDTSMLGENCGDILVRAAEKLLKKQG